MLRLIRELDCLPGRESRIGTFQMKRCPGKAVVAGLYCVSDGVGGGWHVFMPVRLDVVV